MRRLYVGGLNPAVTQKDLKDRFGKFGEVLDVELRTRRDGEGVPYKTFAYVNINISEADLKKCLTVLNKSKWKGGTLQIEAAKESFLHRLAQERQEAAEQHLHRSAAEGQKQNLLESFSKAGVENFTMKAAVPGSEVPGHKDWVVSKFGRVLPVLQLRCQKGIKARTIKYDPSKYCHNIRRLDQNGSDETPSVTQLTWEVEGGDDDISKKRRGEFPSYEPIKRKKTRTGPIDNVFCRSRNADIHRLSNGSDLPTNQRAAHRKWRRPSDSDVDSDEEIRRLVASQQSSHDALQQEAEDDSLEVVGVDYLLESAPRGEEGDYDSAGTDELFESRRSRPFQPTARQFPARSPERKRRPAAGDASSSKPSSSAAAEEPSSDSQSEEDQEEGSCSDSSSGFDFPALFPPNAAHLRISLADLQKLAETRVPSILGSGPEPDRPAAKEPVTPDQILASLLGEDSSDGEGHQRKNQEAAAAGGGTAAPPQASGGTAQTDECRRKTRRRERRLTSGDDRRPSGDVTGTQSDPPSSEEEEEEEAPPPRAALSAEEEEELQRKANLRRLAALQQRQEEAEEHRKLIQGALANLDAPPPASRKHIVFSSDDEEQQRDVIPEKTPLFPDGQSEDRAAAANQKAPQRAVRLKPAGPRLFADDEEDGEEEEDGCRFHLRPQFEGPAGQKLMALQSRFGTDERFRMDSRFLEEEEAQEEAQEEAAAQQEPQDDRALEEEKKKNLSVLQGVLGGGGSKAAGRAQRFRDASALHYDPSREEHAAFETRAQERGRESKAARRRRREEEEAQQRPEVSREIYFQVSGDLKAVFGQTDGGSAQREEERNWDQEEEEEEEEAQSAEPRSQPEESSGFRFSFFGDESEAGSGATAAEYKAEELQAAKVSWLQDPRFQDSSSEEEEEQQEEQQEEQRGAEATNTKEERPSQPDPSSSSSFFFFFSADDIRLKEGPGSFCRSSQLEEQRERWEERSSALRQEYRKKHRDARRKLKSSQRS